MNITIWHIFKYLYKWKFVIIAAVLLSYFAAFCYVNNHQTYNAQVIIEFNDDCISEGKAPDGKEFEPYEIVSPNVLTNVIKDLSLKKTVNSIRSRIKINSIIPDSEKELKESKIKQAQEYEYHPNVFSVTYKGRIGESASDVRDILDSIVDNYLNFYIQSYVSQASFNDITYDEDIGSYDYIEIAEILSDNLDSTVESLGNYYDLDSKFRSSVTGMSFKDIMNEYNHLKDYLVPKLFSDIYRGQITKNKQLLINKYTNKMEKYLLDEKNYTEKAEMAKSRMESFSQANKNVPNAYNSTTGSNNDDLEILDGIYDHDYIKNTITTYDELITKYADNTIAANNCRISADNCINIISKFSVPMDENVNTEELTEEIKKNITLIDDKMSEIYKILKPTVDDFNATNATKHLNPLTGVDCYATVSLSLYALIAVMLGTAVSVLTALTVEIIKELKAYNKRKEEDGEQSPDDDKKDVSKSSPVNSSDNSVTS